MIVVPIRGDKILTVDGEIYTVDSYTNFKHEPAVYVEAGYGKIPAVYFQDIQEINGVLVEYNNKTKTFTSYGLIKRRYHLPQPKDLVEVKVKNGDGNETEMLEVDLVKLHNKVAGVSSGMVIASGIGRLIRVAEIISIKRNNSDDQVNMPRFLRLYKDYLGTKKESKV